MKTLILGLGNPILSDDSVGFHVVQALMGRFDEQEVMVMESDLGGLTGAIKHGDYDPLQLGYFRPNADCSTSKRLSRGSTGVSPPLIPEVWSPGLGYEIVPRPDSRLIGLTCLRFGHLPCPVTA